MTTKKHLIVGSGACSIGLSGADEGIGVLREVDKEKRWYNKLSFQDGRLIGAEFINVGVDPGVILYLIKNGLEATKHKGRLLHKLVEVSWWLGSRTKGVR